jgi:hypothetical protein
LPSKNRIRKAKIKSEASLGHWQAKELGRKNWRNSDSGSEEEPVGASVPPHFNPFSFFFFLFLEKKRGELVWEICLIAGSDPGQSKNGLLLATLEAPNSDFKVRHFTFTRN